MRPTKVRVLVLLAVLAATLGWVAVSLVHGQSGRMLPVPWLAAATMWTLAVALGIWALLSRPRLARRPGTRPMPPIVAARTAALAMAASRTGSLVAGFYLGAAIGAFPGRATPAGQDTLWASLGAASGSLVLVGVALWLEHICRLPVDHDDAKGARPGRPNPRSEPEGVGARIGLAHE